MEPQKPLKIMIVDDDADDRGFMKFLFDKNKNFEIVGCLASGEEALELLTENDRHPDVLLIDLFMPRLSGIEVVDRLQAQNPTHMHIFVISSTVNEDLSAAYRESGKIDFLQKPSSLTEINDLPGILLEKLRYENDSRI